jgi:hypothetical protein
VRIAIVLLLTLLPRVARADLDGNIFMGVEMGSVASASGAFGELVQPGFGGGVRMGLRMKRVGVEVHFGGRGAEGSAMLDANSPSMVFVRSGVSYYALLLGPLQLLGHAELGFGRVTGTREMTVSCPVEDECPGGVRTESQTVSDGGFGRPAGATLQLHLGRHDTPHAMLWASLGTEALRFRHEQEIVSGRTTDFAFGVAFAF